MPISREAVAKRLAEADRVRAALRRCTRERRDLGRWAWEKRGGQRVGLDLIDREVEVLAGEISDHDIAGRWAGIRA